MSLSTETIRSPENDDLSAPEVGSRPKVGFAAFIKAHAELGKVRLNGLVVLTTAVGFLLASNSTSPPNVDFWTLVFTCAGVFLAAVGASAFNQAIEARRDARMRRTENRPIPARIITRTYAVSFGLAASICGVALLCPTSNGLTAMLTAANVLLYAMIYTPMKTTSSINTLVGAVVGALPPIIGWTAVTNSIQPGAWVLAGILFAWQIPHFLALAWLYREDYARGGYKMLPNVEPTGRLTARLALMYTLMLFPFSVLLFGLHHAGVIFLVISMLLTAGFTVAAIAFMRERSNPSARRLFLASIIYLPLMLLTLIADVSGPLAGWEKGDAGYALPSPEKTIDPGSAEAKELFPSAPASPGKQP